MTAGLTEPSYLWRHLALTQINAAIDRSDDSFSTRSYSCLPNPNCMS